MSIPEYIFGSDLKLKLAFIINGQRVKPDTVPFDIRVWTFYPSQAKTASFDGINWVNCVMREDYLEVNLNAPQFTAGRLNADITLHYPDDDMPDKIRDKIVKVRFDNPLVNPDTNDVVITGEVSDTIAGLSAYGVAVWNGFEGTELEWLQSLKQPAIDAAAEAEALMEDFALQELARVDKENTRKQSELSRVAEEQNRVNQELARVDEENTRKQSELSRVAEEQNRVNQELAREEEENTRKQSELSRVAQEQNRVNQELARVDEENTRKQSELSRVAQEQNRVNQELARVDEENTRKQSELSRVAQEQNRVNQELARVEEENTRKSQEIARQNTIAGLGASFDAKVDKTSISQYLGGDETKVMSQKAVTDELVQLAGDLNTHGVLGIEGINKLNPKNYLQDRYISSNGLVQVSQGWKTSDYQNIYDVVSFRRDIQTPFTIAYIAQYDSNKIFIPESYQTYVSTINKINGSAFYRISTIVDIDRVMAVDGAIEGIEFHSYSLIVEKNKEGHEAVFKPNMEDIELKSLLNSIDLKTLDENTKLRIWLLGECFTIDSSATYNPDGSLKSSNVIYPDLKTGSITINRNLSGAAISMVASYNGKNATYTINRDSENKVINTSITIS